VPHAACALVPLIGFELNKFPFVLVYCHNHIYICDLKANNHYTVSDAANCGNTYMEKIIVAEEEGGSLILTVEEQRAIAQYRIEEGLIACL